MPNLENMSVTYVVLYLHTHNIISIHNLIILNNAFYILSIRNAQ